MAAGASAESAASQAANRVIDIPRLSDVRIDGDLEDWGDRGYRIDMLTSLDGRAKSKDDFDPVVRLGWNDEGILAAVTVSDSIPLEAEVLIAPGMDPAHDEVRMQMIGLGDLKDKDADLQPARAARRKMPGGYTMEVLLPWKNLDIRPAAGQEVGLQLTNDRDALVPWQQDA